MAPMGLIERLRYQAGDVWHAMQDAALLWQVRRRGGSYADFYAAKMDRKARKIGVEVNGRPEDKAFHLTYLRQLGLRPSMDLLDYGCGAAAPGVSFIGFLDQGRYTGVDVSSECLALAEARVASVGLSGKRPVFLHLPGGSLAPLDGRQFDVIWAQSVLTHMPPDLIATLFAAVRRMLRPDADFFATFAYADKPRGQSRVKNFEYHTRDLQALAFQAGLEATLVESWEHPASANDRMLRIRHATGQTGQ